MKVITTTRQVWLHIMQHHSDTQFTKRRNKSRFDPNEDLIRLVAQAESHQPRQLLNGNLERVFDAGHVVGIERNSGNPTTIVTVITNSHHELVTMYPGHT